MQPVRGRIVYQGFRKMIISPFLSRSSKKEVSFLQNEGKQAVAYTKLKSHSFCFLSSVSGRSLAPMILLTLKRFFSIVYKKYLFLCS